MQIELSDEQVRTLRTLVQDEYESCAETRGEMFRDDEPESELQQQDAYLAELQQLLVIFPDLPCPDEEED